MNSDEVVASFSSSLSLNGFSAWWSWPLWLVLHGLRATLLLVAGRVDEAMVMLFYIMRKKAVVRCWARAEDDEAVVRCDTGDGV